MSVARVVLDIPSRELDSAFDYDLPDELKDTATVGCAVLVEFGRRPAVGHIVELCDSSAVPDRKPVLEVLTESRFDAVAADLAQWISDEDVAPLSDAVRLFLPPGSVPELVRDGSTWKLREPAVSKVEEKVVAVVPDHGFRPGPTAHRQRAVLDALGAGPVTTAELTATFGSVSSVVRRLQEVGAVTITSRRRFRGPSVGERPAPRHDMLSTGQKDALAAIESASPGACVLLHGVTGSGKTEVYLRAIERELEQDRSAIVLVPEISLTPQTVGRFRARFGDRVAVLHSRLSAGERLDEWDRIAAADSQVVVGARSALFAPVRSLGLVVVDEEHESSYKQGSSPRYHAREVALRLVAARGARLVLGSATPSLETLHACDIGDIERVEMTQRVGGGVLPAVEVVDMGQQFLDGNRSMFSDRLQSELRQVAERREKAVLLLNRRGFASFLLCRECGHVPGCPSCSTSFTFHESGPSLICHPCGRRSGVPATCPECGSPYLRRFGAGTQRVAAEIEALLPGLPVVRMDADTTSAKGGHEQRLAEFEVLPSAVLVGTQMVAKGLDYPEVTLVGVVSADTTLHLPDVRAGERTYQMLEQVAGRAGRGSRPGTVIVQTYWPEHPAIRAVADHDSQLFYAKEREERAALLFPPFGRLANIVVTSLSLAEARTRSSEVAKALLSVVPESWEVLGPVPAPLARLNKRHRWHVLLKAPPGSDVSAKVRVAISHVRASRTSSLAIDIDPVDLM